jgi:hypothetical protein
MRIGLDNISIAVRSWRSKTDFERFLERARDSIALADPQIEDAEAFFSLTIQTEPDGHALWTVGVRAENHGLLPEAVVLQDTLVVGADRMIHFLSFATRTLQKSVSLDFLFHSFIMDRTRSLVLVLHEGGLAAFSLDGAERWNLVRDLVETVHVEGDRVEISFMDKAPVQIAIDSGRELRA